ncbi:MAG: hypothetical protein JWR16_2697 [Nevskia sp.]|nr:hypothetical protein [Nevskia sp.]
MGDITRLLERARAGDAAAHDALFTRVYDELRVLARQNLSHQSTLTQLDAPSLVHEAYLRLTAQDALPGANHRMFFAYASRVMRSVIMDYVRERAARKRGGGLASVTLNTGIADTAFSGPQLVAVDSALQSLKQVDQRSHDIFEMHFYAGLAVEDICEVLQLSPATVKRELRKSRAFVFNELGFAAP